MRRLLSSAAMRLSAVGTALALCCCNAACGSESASHVPATANGASSDTARAPSSTAVQESTSTTTTTTRSAPPPPTTDPIALSQTSEHYPRAIVLQHSGAANGQVIAEASEDLRGGVVAAVYGSTTEGVSFTSIGEIDDPAATPGLCCTTLFEVPRQLGTLAAGTLLWAGSFGAHAAERRMSLRVWQSTDTGRTWHYLSTAYQAPNTGGLWEPSFEVDAAGRLVMQFSNETMQPAHSQFLSETESSDGGRTWSAPAPTVRSADPAYRPGMATVQELPDRTFVMTYEVCGVKGKFGCAVHLRTSPDGWSWGDPNDMGTIPTDGAGDYFAHTPTIVWSPAGGPSGSLLLIGELLYSAAGQPAKANGETYFTNADGGKGPWRARQAPVPVPGAQSDPCTNYSPTLVPLENGARLLEITTHKNSEGTCLAYFASRTVAP